MRLNSRLIENDGQINMRIIFLRKEIYLYSRQ